MSHGRVLLLEDDLALRGLLDEALAAEGFDVIVFDAFADLHSAAERRAGEVIVADFWGGGQRTLLDQERTEIRELGTLLPVILLTGRSWASETTAAELGARALMRKPFDLDELVNAIARVLPQQ